MNHGARPNLLLNSQSIFDRREAASETADDIVDCWHTLTRRPVLMAESKFVTAADINLEKQRIERAMKEMLDQFERDSEGVAVRAIDMQRIAVNPIGERSHAVFDLKLRVELD